MSRDITLGQVRCVGSKEPLTPTELHLAIYLAFNRNGANSDTIATMVWPNGAAQRTITNTMASLRRKLGTVSTTLEFRAFVTVEK